MYVWVVYSRVCVSSFPSKDRPIVFLSYSLLYIFFFLLFNFLYGKQAISHLTSISLCSIIDYYLLIRMEKKYK